MDVNYLPDVSGHVMIYLSDFFYFALTKIIYYGYGVLLLSNALDFMLQELFQLNSLNGQTLSHTAKW